MKLEPGWLRKQLDAAAERASQMPYWMTRTEPGAPLDRCAHCGGWISMGHAEGSTCRESPQTAEEIAEVLAATGNG